MLTASTTFPESDFISRLTSPGTDLGGTYSAVAALQFSLRRMSADKQLSAVQALARVLSTTPHPRRRQAYFLHRKAAGTLQEILIKATRQDVAEQARGVLVQCLTDSGSTALRAAAESLGGLPLKLPSPNLPLTDEEPPVTEISWPDLLGRLGETPSPFYVWKGRNLVLSLPVSGRVLTVKTVPLNAGIQMLQAEGLWMDYLADRWPDISDRPDRFMIPQPIKVRNRYVFKVDGLPDPVLDITRGCYAIAYLSDPDYFRYPNEYDPSRPFSNREILIMLSNAAFILGRLSSEGIVHTAPIPLFHNRVQRHRREDRGVYHWPRGGRLDQWLESCRYPNIGKTGLRDFEHFIVFNDNPKKLYEFIGTHLLSLVLVAGSCFRYRDISRIGVSSDKTPIDARDLFDPVLLKAAVTRIFYAYYQGFTNTRFSGKPPMDLGLLTGRLIEEMGVDRHMEEILRVAEQQEMTDRQFVDFLMSRGVDPECIAGMKKGDRDVTLLTGPHLGAFNRPISLPELTEFVAVSAAVCIGGRYFSGGFV